MKLSSIITVTVLLLAAAGIVRAEERPFIVFDPTVPEELKLSDDQKQKLKEKLPGFLNPKSPDFGLKSKAPDAAAHKELWAFLKEMLTAEQFKRFQQLVLQHDAPLCFLRPGIVKELKITDEQQKQIKDIILDFPRMRKEASAKPPEPRIKGIRPKILEDFHGRAEAILTDAQKKQWKEMCGEWFDSP